MYDDSAPPQGFTDEPSDQPPEGEESWVKVTVNRETMLQVRDELHDRLIYQYHLLKLAARANRKAGNTTAARTQDATAARVALMIWSLRNPRATQSLLESEIDHDEGRHTLDHDLPAVGDGEV